MAITNDRNAFLGAHLTEEVKERLRVLAEKTGTSMSELVFGYVVAGLNNDEDRMRHADG